MRVRFLCHFAGGLCLLPFPRSGGRTHAPWLFVLQLGVCVPFQALLWYERNKTLSLIPKGLEDRTYGFPSVLIADKIHPMKDPAMRVVLRYHLQILYGTVLDRCLLCATQVSRCGDG